MSKTKTRSRDPEATRSSVLDAARRLFADKGFAGTSMREIASISGVSQPLIYYHFGSKEGLYRAVKEHLIAEARTFLAVAGESPGDSPGTSEMIRAMYDYLSGNREMMRLIAWSHLEGDFTPWPGEQELVLAMVEHVRRGQSAGSMRKDIDPLIATIMIEALILVWCQYPHYFATFFQEPIETASERYLDQVFNLLSLDTPARREKE